MRSEEEEVTGPEQGDRTPERPGDEEAGTARLTPYELAFASDAFEATVFPRILDEAEAHREDAGRRDRFLFLPSVGQAVRDLVPPEAPAEMLDDYRVLFYHAFNYWRFGRRTYVLEPAVARYLVEAAPRLENWELEMSVPSLYVQLPPRLFWASISTDVPPEPVDGFFVTEAPANDPLGDGVSEIEVLLVLGIRRERPGFSVIAFETEVGPGIPAVWTETPGRAGGADFANVLPGGEIAGLYSILTIAEALKLAARAIWYLDAHPADLVLERAPERRGHDRPGSLPRSRLPYHRVRFGGAADDEPGGGPHPAP